MLSSRQLATVLAGLFCVSFGQSQTIPLAIWLNIGTDFNSPGNWSDSTLPTPAHRVEFGDASAPIQPNVSASTTVAGVRFTNGFMPSEYNLTASAGATLTIGSLGIENNEIDGKRTVSAPIAFQGPDAKIINDGELVIAGNVDTGASTNLVLRGSGAFGTVTGNIAGTAGLIKDGFGTWTLSGANTFTGRTEIRSGTLEINSDASLGAAPGTFVADAITIEAATLRTTETMTLNSNRGITLRATGSTIETDIGTQLTYGGTISGFGELRKEGEGILILSGPNTYSGRTFVFDGVLRDGAAYSFSRDSTIEMRGGQLEVNFDQQIKALGGSPGIGGVTLAEGATLTLLGVGERYAGTIDGGGGLTIASGFHTLGGANTYTGTTRIKASGVLAVTNSEGSATGTGSVEIESGGLLQLGDTTSAGSISGNILNNGSLFFAGSATSRLDGVISGSGSLQAGNAGGSGTLVLGAANTYTGPTSIVAGTLRAAAADALPRGGWVGMRDNSDATLEVLADQTIRELHAPVGTNVILGPGATLAISPAAGFYGGVLEASVSGTGHLTFAGGAGTSMVVRGANTYSGGTNIAGGTLYIEPLFGGGPTLPTSTVTSTALGTGAVTVAPGAALIFRNGGNARLGNNLAFGNGATVGTLGFGDPMLTFSGNSTFATGPSALTVLGTVEFAGNVAAAAGMSELTFSSGPKDYGRVLLSGTLDPSISSLNLDGSSVIFGSAGALPASLVSIKGIDGYVGLAKPGGAELSSAGVVSRLDATFTGVLGFDTLAEVYDTPGAAAAVFAQDIDLSSLGSRVTLGSSTVAILTGQITPSTSGYLFGNGGGALVVGSALGGSHNLTVESGLLEDNHLVTVLRGTNTFTGSVSVENSALVVDSATALPAGRKVELVDDTSVEDIAYLGFTEVYKAGSTVAELAAEHLGSYTANSVIGLDSHTYIQDQLTTGSSAAVRVVSDTIDLSDLSAIGLGTATALEIDGTIVAPSDGTLRLVPLGDGKITVNSTIDASKVNSVVVGSSATDIEGGVALNGANTYSGGTTLKGGTLVIGKGTGFSKTAGTSSGIGTGTLTVDAGDNEAQLLLTQGVSLDNNVQLNSTLKVAAPKLAATTSSTSGTASTTAFSSGYLDLYGIISGSGGLDVFAPLSLGGANTFSGGVTLWDGALTLHHDQALGTGQLKLMPSYSGAVLQISTRSPRTINNAVAIVGWPETQAILNGQFTFNGPVTMHSNTRLIASETVVFNGDITGTGSLVSGGTGFLMLNGTNTYAGRTVSESGGIVFSRPGSLPNPTPSSPLVARGGGYVGIGFVPANLQTDFIDRFDRALTTATIGFDTDPALGAPNVFAGNIDLSSFGGSPLLGSASRAVLNGTITPSGESYRFGGGGGTLTVTSPLVDQPDPEVTLVPRSVTVTSPSAPLTLRLRGANTYTGGTHVIDSGVIFEAGALPSSGVLYSSGGAYIGTADPAHQADPAAFVSKFDAATDSVIVGFDDGLNVAADISLAHFTESTARVYLGTATSAILGGNITLPSMQNDYRFAGYKGGSLTVQSTLTGARSVVIGDATNAATHEDPLTGIVSSVTLSGTNSYTGNTILDGGILYVGSDTALGTGAVIANRDDTALLAAGGPRTVANSVSLLYTDLSVGGDQDLHLSGTVSGDYGLTKIGNGTLTLSGANVFDDLVITGGHVLVQSATGAGGGALMMEAESAVSATFLESSTIQGLEGTSAATLNLTAGKTFTIIQDFDSDFYGTIAGSTAGLTFSGLDGAIHLAGASTFKGPVTINGDFNVIAGNANALGDTTNVVTVQPGGKLAVQAGVVFANPITLANGTATAARATLGGSGIFRSATDLNIGLNQSIAPGEGGTGTLTFELLSTSKLLLNQNGLLEVDMANADMTTGAWDKVVVNGTVDVLATTDNPFRVVLNTSLSDTTEFLLNFDPTKEYQWMLLKATTITGFSSDKFVVNENDLWGFGDFSFSMVSVTEGSALMLNFTPVPEPSTYALILAGLGVTFFVSRRKRSKR